MTSSTNANSDDQVKVTVDSTQVDRLLERKRKRWKRARKRINPDSTDEDEEEEDGSSQRPAAVTRTTTDAEEIDLIPSSSIHENGGSNHVYQWVVIMEHQRGFVCL